MSDHFQPYVDTETIKAHTKALRIHAAAMVLFNVTAGMTAENEYRTRCGNQVAYTEEAFVCANLQYNATVGEIEDGHGSE